MALLLTVTSNLLGVATVPFFVKAVLCVGNASAIDSVDLFKKLVIPFADIYSSTVRPHALRASFY